MSRTVIDIIKRAYKQIGVYSIGETPTADEAVDGLAALNAMLDEWATEQLIVNKVLDTIPLTANVGSYTIGASGDVVTARPDTIDSSSYFESGGVSYPITVLSLDAYNDLTQKGLGSSIPCAIWYNPTYPNGTITVYPKPTAAMTLNLWSIKPAGYVNLTDVMSLTPAEENAITKNLACELALEFGMPASPLLLRGAASAKKKIKRRNYQPHIMESNYPIQGRFNIDTGVFR
jgi:hypothetical protein